MVVVGDRRSVLRRKPKRPSSPPDTIVDDFHSFSYDDPESLTAQLRAVLAGKSFPKRAQVTIWGLRSAHRFMLLPPAAPRDVEALARREARQDLAALEAQGDTTSTGVALGALRETPAGPRREALLVAALAGDVRRRIQPLVDAGLTIDGVVTPGLALSSVARVCSGATTGATDAYVAIGREATALAVVRDGLLLFVREMPWGHQAESSNADAFETRLASELRRSFLYLKQSFKAEVSRVLVCGDRPEVRSLTFPLMQTLDMEIETLDSMQGIDVTALPQRAESFRDEIAALRLAWGVAADATQAINLLPTEILAGRAARQQRLVLGGSMAAAIAAGALLFFQADTNARAHERELEQLQQQVAMAEPHARALLDDRERQEFDRVRLTALEAFDAQGPRLARVLEVIADAAPSEIVLNTFSVRPYGASWRVTVAGIAMTTDAALAQAAVNRYLRDLQASPYLGAPTRSPSLRMRVGTPVGEAAESPDDGSAAVTLPAGMSGIDFSVEFEVRK